MQSPHFGILSISNSHPRQPANPPPGKQGNPGQQPQLLVPIIVMNTSNSASRHREKEKKKESKVPQAPKKERYHLPETAHTLLIVPVNLTKHFQPEGLSMILIKMYLQTLQELTKMREKVRERKERLWQLCCKEMLCS